MATKRWLDVLGTGCIKLRRAWCALLLLALLTSRVSGDQYRPELTDEASRTACGPIACYVAARSLDIDVTLDELVRRCGWSPGRRVSIGDLRAVLAGTAGLDANAVRMGPLQVRDALRSGRCAIVLAVRKDSDSINHAVVAVDAGGDGVTIVDYPALASTLTLDELADRWDGAAIIVTPATSANPVDLAKAMPMTTGLALLLVAICAVQALRTRIGIVPATMKGSRTGVSI